ncbi:MAG: 30S ribosomal protein S8 [bacterium]|nr:30S ribosomal protein S8 [bacterium]
MVTDPIADMFTCIRNANAKLHEKLDVPASIIKEKILDILKKEGFITSYKKIEVNKKSTLRIFLKYHGKETVIKGIKRVSKPGLRIYKSVEDMPKVRSGMGVAIISTSQGLMTDWQAKKNNIGGEVLGYIW